MDRFKGFSFLFAISLFLPLFTVESATAQIQQFPMQPTPSPTPFVDQITFSSGLIVYSPLNKVYNSYSVLCDASLRVPYGYQSSLGLRIDGKDQNETNFKLNFGSSGKYHLDGSFMLPPLNNGPHQLTFNVQISIFNYSGPPPSADFKAGTTSYGVNYYSANYVNSVSFTINSNDPFPTPTPTQAPTPTPTVTPTTTPIIPEFPSIIILALLGTATFAVAVKYRQKANPKASDG